MEDRLALVLEGGERVGGVFAKGEIVRKVDPTRGYISFKGDLWPVPEAFAGETLAIRPRGTDGQYAICFGAYEIKNIHLNKPETPK